MTPPRPMPLAPWMFTKLAMEAIGKDDPRADWILRPEEHADRLPAEAGALKRILERPEYEKAGKKYPRRGWRPMGTSAIQTRWPNCAGHCAFGYAGRGNFLIFTTREVSPTVRIFERRWNICSSLSLFLLSVTIRLGTPSMIGWMRGAELRLLGSNSSTTS